MDFDIATEGSAFSHLLVALSYLLSTSFATGRWYNFKTFFSLTLLQDLSFIFQQVQGLSGYTSPRGECNTSLLTYPPYRLRSLRDCLAAELGATTWQSHGYASVDILVHNRAGDLARSRARGRLAAELGAAMWQSHGLFFWTLEVDILVHGRVGD
jgi:hypothetical protein